MITASRLLKSWAIPPASCPRLSRRWAWCSWFSSRCRSASVSSRSRSRAATTRSLTSRMAAITSVPSSVSMLDRLISAGNSPPSRRRPNSSSPPPIGRVRGSAKYPARTERCESRKRSGTSTSTGCPTSSSRAYPNSASTWALTSTISPSRPTPTIASGKSSSRAVCIASSRNRAVGSASAAVTRSWWPLCIRPEFHIPGLFHLDSVPPYARAGHDAGSCEYTNQCNKWCDLFARAGFAGGGGAHRGVERPRTSSGPGSGASGCAEQPRELVRQGERVKRLGDHPGRAETFQGSPVRALRLGGQEYDGHPRREPLGSQPPKRGGPIHAGHHHVQQYRVERPVLAGGPQCRLAARARHDRPAADAFEAQAGDRADALIVLHEQQAWAHRGACMGPALCACSKRSRTGSAAAAPSPVSRHAAASLSPALSSPGVGTPAEQGAPAPASGSVKRKLLPCPGALSAQRRPPWLSTMPRAMARPRPLPLFSRASEMSTWLKRSKIASSWSAGMPLPLSVTENRAHPSPRPTVTVTRLSRGENLIALPSRLTSVCTTRSASAHTLSSCT